MGIIASCGHQVEEIEDTINVASKGWTINESGWQKVIEYKSICKDCLKNYKKTDSICDTEAEEFDWLTGRE